MKTLFLDAPYVGKVELCKGTLDFLKEKKVKTVGLYASVQFCSKLASIEEQLKILDIDIISSQPGRAHVVSQLLGCDSSKDSLKLSTSDLDKIDYYLYVGDGNFHPLALVYSQKESDKVKPVICNDPIAKKMRILDVDSIKKNLGRYKGALVKFMSARKIGVIITIKPGQEQFAASKMLSKKFPDKKFYYFVDNNISFNQLENFPFIETWVNTACPRIGLDDQEMFRKGVLNLSDVLQI
jgi:2-(3-amino-3-carboxypropyl)histidine synthase